MVIFPHAAWHCSLFVLWFVSYTAQKEEEFAVYEPYCANYTNASELMLMEEQNLVVRLIFTRRAYRSPGRPNALW
jgi:hypothetical protein